MSDEQKEEVAGNRQEVDQRRIALIRKADFLSRRILRQLDGKEFPLGQRTIIAASCLDLVIEHHRGILVLVGDRVYGSACALIRPAFEALVRGIWLARCASAEELDRFVQEKIDPTFAELIQRIEKIEGFEKRTFSQIKKNAWPLMNSLTHGSMQQVMRRSSGRYIQPDYTLDEIEGVVKMAGTFALFALLELAVIIGDRKLAASTLKLLDGDADTISTYNAEREAEALAAV